MEAVVGLMLLLGLSHGADVYCDGRQNVAQCYGALGGTVDVQLMDSTSGIFRYQWKKNNTTILDVRQNGNVINRIENRSILTPSNGTFRINNLNRKDGGEYDLIIFDSNGKESSSKILHLIIQAPVSSVLLVSECVSEGQVRASCSSEGGDSPQYSWTLDGHNLTDAELLSGHGESDTIALKQHVSGRLVCSAWNQVSRVSKEKIITNCAGHSLLVCVVRAAVAVLLLIGISAYFAWKRATSNKAEGSAVAGTRDHPENSVLMVEV